ncbi:MAG: 3-keto-5-aminohexanoate cleavage protein [Desulfobacterales bacterium]|nr:MAG: 3-keto-5-aminohexanoate cleavage protein [Desulfobacterales bacterium]
MEELIICVAPYPGEKQAEKLPTPVSLIDEVVRAHAAGASIAHLHVRDAQGLQTSDTSLFQRQVAKIHAACPVIIEGSTGGTPEHSLQERCAATTVAGIEMGSLNLGSINMHGGVYQNSMPDIRYYATQLKQRSIKPFLCVFDLSMFHNARRLEQEGLLEHPQVYNLVFGIPDTLPYSPKTLDIFGDQLPANAVWFLTRHHAPAWQGWRDALKRGGHVRVGFEDGPFLASGERARSNAQLVEEVVRGAEALGRKVVGPQRAREILGLVP